MMSKSLSARYSLNAYCCSQIRGGSIAEGSEVQLEIAEFSWCDVKVASILHALLQQLPWSCSLE